MRTFSNTSGPGYRIHKVTPVITILVLRQIKTFHTKPPQIERDFQELKASKKVSVQESDKVYEQVYEPDCTKNSGQITRKNPTKPIITASLKTRKILTI